MVSDHWTVKGERPREKEWAAVSGMESFCRPLRGFDLYFFPILYIYIRIYRHAEFRKISFCVRFIHAVVVA